MNSHLQPPTLRALSGYSRLHPRALFYVSNGRLCAGLISAPAQPPACPLAALDVIA